MFLRFVGQYSLKLVLVFGLKLVYISKKIVCRDQDQQMVKPYESHIPTNALLYTIILV